MKKQYDEAMEKIQVTDEMRQRILQHIQQTSFEKETAKILRFSQYKKLLVSAACFAILLLGALTLPFLFKGMPSQEPELLGAGKPFHRDSLSPRAFKAGGISCGGASLPALFCERNYLHCLGKSGSNRLCWREPMGSLPENRRNRKIIPATIVYTKAK